MWCGFGKSSATVATVCLVTASIVISDTALAVRNYTPKQFRAVLHGLGYKVNVSNAPLTDAETKAAIKEFQKGYKLKPSDGVAGAKTEDFAASIVEILQANLNLVLKPKSPLPRNHYFGSQTAAAVKEYQRKNQLPETGIADLALRQKLDQEAENLITNPASAPTKKPSTKPKASPTATPTASPEATSTPTESPTASPEATSTPTATPTPTSTSKPRTKPTSTPRSKS